MVKKAFKFVDKTFAFVEDWSLFVAVAIALMSAMANVILRKTTDINLYWSDEVVRKVIVITSYSIHYTKLYDGETQGHSTKRPPPDHRPQRPSGKRSPHEPKIARCFCQNFPPAIRDSRPKGPSGHPAGSSPALPSYNFV